MISMVPGFQGSRVPGFQGSRVPGFQDSRIPGFQGSKVPGSGFRFLLFAISFLLIIDSLKSILL
jgi:hypothetical protein